MKLSLKLKVNQANFKEWLATATSCRYVIFFGLDLRSHDEQLAKLSQAESHQESAIFLGCKIGPKLAGLLVEHHALIFPNIPGKPYQIYRKSLYTVEELFAGYDPQVPESYSKTADWKIYLDEKEIENDEAFFIKPTLVKFGTEEHLARTLHDHFIQDQVDQYVESFSYPAHRGVVAIIGGHRILRSSRIYFQMATICRALTREGFLVASGGSDGIMEAANLGAWFAPLPDEEMIDAIKLLSIDGADSSDGPLWLSAAWNVRNKTLQADVNKRRSLNVSTWYYRVQNIFATHIAKFFDYDLREDTLISIGKQGLIYAQGSAGTFQEIFQAAYKNHYHKNTYNYYSPMVFFGEEYWNPTRDTDGAYPKQTEPVWPLLSKLARDSHFEHCLKITSNSNEVIDFIKNFKATL